MLHHLALLYYLSGGGGRTALEGCLLACGNEGTWDSPDLDGCKTLTEFLLCYRLVYESRPSVYAILWFCHPKFNKSLLWCLVLWCSAPVDNQGSGSPPGTIILE